MFYVAEELDAWVNGEKYVPEKKTSKDELNRLAEEFKPTDEPKTAKERARRASLAIIKDKNGIVEAGEVIFFEVSPILR